MEKKIIVVRNSEVLPSDKGGRLWRSGMYVKFFQAEGRAVDWVVSSFDHYNKKQRRKLLVKEEVVMLRSPGYKKNVSIMRVFDHVVFSVKLFWYLMKQNNIKFIHCSYPTPESSFVSVLVGKIKKVPVVIDVRDLWPDVFFDTTKSKLIVLKKILLSPYVLLMKYSMKNASILMAANQDFLSWGQKFRSTRQKEGDFVSFIPFEEPVLTCDDKKNAANILKNYNIDRKSILIVFGGTIGSMFEFDTLLSALEMAEKNGLRVSVLICGDGESLSFWMSKFKGFDNVFFPGRLKTNVLFSLLAEADLLLACYKNISGFHGHLPNKFMEYCSAGKPIINGLKGYASDLIDAYSFGVNYNNANELYDALVFYEKKENIIEHSVNARSLYNSRFHPDVLCLELLENLKQLNSN